MHRIYWFLTAMALALLAGSSWLCAQEKAAPVEKKEMPPAAVPKPKFVRLAHNEAKQPVALETIIVSYRSRDPKQPEVQVDLIGAVHVAEKEYYQALNKQFEQYDALLFELVAPENVKVPKERPAGATSMVGAMQLGMKEMLELDFQLDCIDYSAANFVHADMSPHEFAKSMENRGESFFKMYLRAMGHGMSKQNGNLEKNAEWQLMLAMFSKNRAHRLKLIMAEQFDDLENQIGILEGPEGSTILTERNKKALQVLDRELKAGKKKLGIFYGAAHLPDMETRLLKEFNMQRTGEKWLPAWNLKQS